ncbi:MAG: hypothetical protein AAFW70_15480 [Cyanobacteria bacterium J06635_10]
MKTLDSIPQVGIERAHNSFDAWVSSGVFTRKQVPLNDARRTNSDKDSRVV